ncbi:MAG: deoxyribose-phosphate aldolase [Candidatus Njordarchaeota archaeon]
MNKIDLSKRIDHTNLKPNASEESITKTILEAKKYEFRGVCIPLIYVSKAKEILRNTNIKVITVIGFPLGYTPTEIKMREAMLAAEYGADEIDIVMNISLFKSKKYDYVLKDLKTVISAAKLPAKVIIETSYLTKNEIIEASRIVMSSGAFCVKTNTGFGSRGVSIEDIKIIKSVVDNKMKIKASGGIRTAKQALDLIQAGADILGTSSGVKIIEEIRKIE